MEHSSPHRDRMHAAMTVVLVLMCLSYVGCDEDRHHDRDVQSLQELAKRAWVPADARERVAEAIRRCQSHMRDPQPILIAATLIKPEQTEKRELGLWVFDIDKDLAGFVVKEISRDPNGMQTTIEELYPLFAHYPPTAIEAYGNYLAPVLIRDARQRKDEKLWAAYLAIDFDALVKVQIPESRSSLRFWDTYWRVWDDALPAIWISLAEPSKVHVSVYVYDKAGHESNVVNLLVNPAGGTRGQALDIGMETGLEGPGASEGQPSK